MSTFLHSMYWGHPWYAGAVWGNVFVIPIGVLLTWLWSKTKFWPPKVTRRLIRQRHARQDEHNEWMAKHMEEVYRAHFHTRPAKHPHFDIGKDREA